MPVVVTLDAVLTGRGVKAKDLARRIGLSETQLSLMRSGKVRGLRFETIAKLCAALDCAPGDLLGYRYDPADLPEAPVSAEEEESL
jgi:putative transcriptional regulator